MRSLEANRLRYRWRIVGGTLALCIAFFGLPMTAAWSTMLSTPDASGNYAHCNLVTDHGAGWNAASGLTVKVACQWGGTTLGLSSGGGLNISYTGATAVLGGTSSWCFATPQAHAFTADAAYTPDTRSCGGGNGGGSGTVGAWSCASILIDSATRQCVIDSVTVGTGSPVVPTDYYAGGSPGPVLDATVGTSTCSRTLTSTADMTGEFAVGRTGMANASVTAYDWDWGDSTTHGTTATAKHTYGALSTQPVNGWTAINTMTITATSGHLFSDGTSVKTGTCSLRVDFLHPDQTTAGGTGGGAGSTGDSGLDACLPSGWNVLNPLALIGGVGCVLKYLFIPSSTTTTSLGHLWDTVTTHLPFSVVTGFVSYIPSMWDDFQFWGGKTSPLTCGFSCETSPLCTVSKGGDMPNGSPLNLCPGGDHYPFLSLGGATAVGILRAVMLFIIVALFVYAMWRGANEILQS
jgi:hypothetical protein